ncbi:GNAT family N-acetyltransferase [Thermodesulfobacteriota bacterium]
MEGIFSIRNVFGNKRIRNKTELSPDNDALSNIKDKITTPEEAISCVKSGDRVFVGTGCATPRTLTLALENLDKNLEDVQMYHFLVNGAITFEEGIPKTKFYHKAFFVDSDMREVIKHGKGDYIPISIGQVPNLIKNGALTIDVALIQVTMPDQHGFVSLGVSTDITHAVIQRAGVVIAELNPNMPRTYGDTLISMDQIDKAVVVDSPVIEYIHPHVDDSIAERIARNVARIIDNGSTLQIGIGRIPNEMLKYLTDRRDLGIHSDVITDSIVDLIEKGIITGQAKSIHTGQIVTSYCLGTRRLYDLIDNNPLFSFHPIEYVSNPSVISSNNKMVSVTQAFAVDLMGQVCSDQFEGELYSGVSTQPDFLRGSANSPEGKPIICLASTTEGGKESRIRPLLHEGEGVSIPRSDVHYVVTECGTAYLFGKTIGEKVLALIEIAHPSFRPWLLEEGKRLGYLRADQELKCKGDGNLECWYPQEEEREFDLKNNTKIVVRPSKASDVSGLQELFYNLPPKDVYTRFFTSLRSLSVSEAEHFCNVDYENEMAFIVTTGEREKEKIIGSSFYVVNPSTNMADVAYMILPKWQGMGLGIILQQRMIEYAKSKGLKGFTADILAENVAMLKLAKKCGKVTTQLSQGAYEVEMLFS